MKLFLQAQVLWSQMDANQHLRHSAYADLAAQARLNMLVEAGITFELLLAAKIGPIIFREELIYMREIRLGEIITVNCELNKSRTDGSRWSIRHELIRADGVKAAVNICEGAWINTEKRKLTVLTPEMAQMWATLPRSEDYEDIPQSAKAV